MKLPLFRSPPFSGISKVSLIILNYALLCFVCILSLPPRLFFDITRTVWDKASVQLRQTKRSTERSGGKRVVFKIYTSRVFVLNLNNPRRTLTRAAVCNGAIGDRLVCFWRPGINVERRLQVGFIIREHARPCPVPRNQSSIHTRSSGNESHVHLRERWDSGGALRFQMLMFVQQTCPGNFIFFSL